MVIDLILDRRDNIRDGYKDTYDAYEFYNDCREYAQDFEDDVQWKIVDALDSGANEDVQKALCDYIDICKYNPNLKDFIKSTNWITD